MKSEITLITTLSSEQVDELVGLYRNEFWCNSRSRPDIDKMLRNTDIVIGAVNGTGKLVGFARVLTDFVYKATIYDLIIHLDWRKKNLGRKLMDAIIGHPKLKDVEHFDLNCLPEMLPFYEKWNFSSDLNGLCFMRRFNRDDSI